MMGEPWPQGEKAARQEGTATKELASARKAKPRFGVRGGWKEKVRINPDNSEKQPGSG